MINSKFWKLYISFLILTILIGGCLQKILGTQDKEYILKVQFKSKSQCLSYGKKFEKQGFEFDCKEVNYEF
jgi:hypothetical protein